MDARIEHYYGKHVNGRVIGVMDIGKIFAAGRAAAKAGADVEAAVIEAMNVHCTTYEALRRK